MGGLKKQEPLYIILGILLATCTYMYWMCVGYHSALRTFICCTSLKLNYVLCFIGLKVVPWGLIHIVTWVFLVTDPDDLKLFCCNHNLIERCGTLVYSHVYTCTLSIVLRTLKCMSCNEHKFKITLHRFQTMWKVLILNSS